MGLEQGYRNNLRKLKGLCFKIYLQLHGCKVGKGLKCYTFPKLRAVPNSNITIGDNVTFGFNCTLEITNKGNLLIEDNVNITQNVLISSSAKVSIGKYTLIAENVSIRDTEHEILRNKIIQKQNSISQEILIGEDVWLGANTVVLRGSNIPSGVVIGANSLVKLNSKMEAFKIYAGSPVQLIKERV